MIELNRKTGETDITLSLELYGKGEHEIETGIGFFDHMLELWSRHGFFDLKIKAEGDLSVDKHHTVEDVGIVLGQAINQELGDRAGIRRYGDVLLPMDEVLVHCAVDLGGRSYYHGEITTDRQEINGFPVELFHEFYRGLTNNGNFNLHFVIHKDGNAHHLLEACFKAWARAFDRALKPEERLEDSPLSTKGQLVEGGRH